MEARSILVSGSRWRVGDGSLIRIWNDRWLDRPHLFRPLMSSSLVAGVEYVANLIVAETASWNYNLVNELFLVRHN